MGPDADGSGVALPGDVSASAHHACAASPPYFSPRLPPKSLRSACGLVCRTRIYLNVYSHLCNCNGLAIRTLSHAPAGVHRVLTGRRPAPPQRRQPALQQRRLRRPPTRRAAAAGAGALVCLRVVTRRQPPSPFASASKHSAPFPRPRLFRGQCYQPATSCCRLVLR